MKGGYKHITDTSPAVVVSPGDGCNQPYHLHAQDGQIALVSPQHHKQLRPTVSHSRSSSFSTQNYNDNTLQGGFKDKHESSCDNAGENISRSPELKEQMEDTHAKYKHKVQTYYGRGLRHTRVRRTQSTATLETPEVISNKKLERRTEDIVERNKMTLGRQASKHGSYVTVHARKQEKPHHVDQVCIEIYELIASHDNVWNSPAALNIQAETVQMKDAAITETDTRSCTSTDNDSWVACFCSTVLCMSIMVTGRLWKLEYYS